jgi:TRAP-type mannitol/chloroaromatic compound transport system permease small subunit
MLSWCYSLAPSGFQCWQVDMLIEVEFTSMILQGICLKVELLIYDSNSY